MIRRDFLSWLSSLVGTFFLAACGADSIASDDAASTDTPPPGDDDIEATHDINTTDEPATCVQTAADILGPKYREGAPLRATMLAEADEPGERLRIDGVVLSACGVAAAGATLDVWQANSEGIYDDEGYRLRGKFVCDDSGRFRFDTVLPGAYQDRPRHIHLIIENGQQQLTTQLYFAGDPALAPNDPCTSCHSDEPSLIIDLVDTTDGKRGSFDIVLT